MRKKPGSRALRAALCLALALVVGCGTILYPERRGQRVRGDVDVAVVLMNAAWVLVGVVPGVIAFIVDLSTGALYEPPGGRSWLPVEAGERLAVAPGTTLELSSRARPRGADPWTVTLRAGAADEPIRTWVWEGDGPLSIELPSDLSPRSYEIAFREGSRRIGAFALRVDG